MPREWRQAYAVAMHMYMRPEQQEALAWTDVDFTARTASVNKAVEARTGTPKELPKTAAAVRDVPIEPVRMPLLAAFYEAREGDSSPVVPAQRTMNDKFRAKQLREHLTLARVTRPA